MARSKMLARISRGLHRRGDITRRFLLSRFGRVRWIVRPADLTGHKVCLLASFTGSGTLSRHTLDWCTSWHERGFKVILVVAMDAPSRFEYDGTTTQHIAGLLVRQNIGYDFGSWVAGLAKSPGILRSSLLAVANDSMYGPLDGFDRMLSRVDASDGDVIGMVESHERTHHLQSFLIFYRATALKTAAFRRFWKRIPLGGRDEAISNGELKLMSTMLSHGLKVDVLHGADRSTALNPTLSLWRELIDAGFPFVKIQLLRDNPKMADLDGWDEVLRRCGYDPDRVREHLGAGYATSAAASALVAAPSPVSA